jgi:hypothetical protein
MARRSREPITTDESTVVAIPFLDTLVVKYGKSDGRFPDPPWADEREGLKVFSETNDLFDQSVASKTGPRWRGRSFRRLTGLKPKALDNMEVVVTNLVWS